MTAHIHRQPSPGADNPPFAGAAAATAALPPPKTKAHQTFRGDLFLLPAARALPPSPPRPGSPPGPIPPLTPLTPLPAPAATPAATRASSPLLASLLMEPAARKETEASAGETQLGSRADPWRGSLTLAPEPLPAAPLQSPRPTRPLLGIPLAPP